MSNKVAFSNQHSSLDDIGRYYLDSNSALDAYFDQARQNDQFIGYTLKELNEELKKRKDVLDRMCSLEILAALEAHFRIDYLIRCQDKKKDQLSRKMREIFNDKLNRASLVDDILRLWKEVHPSHKKYLDAFQKALDYRNWLAHGRYWESKKSPHIYKYDYQSISRLANDMLANMPLVDN